ncbi:hypothetical protein BGX38DRAFT_318259 [Terfezia claveryi]|nr:hypothetical protein BGX38DRAFT_318259 [Terfezia claveryi]
MSIQQTRSCSNVKPGVNRFAVPCIISAFIHIICQYGFLLGAAEAKREPSVAEAMKGFHAILDPHRYYQTSIHTRFDWKGQSLIDRRVCWLAIVSFVLNHLTVAKYFLQIFSIPETHLSFPSFLTNVREPLLKTLASLPPNIGNPISILVLNTVSGLQHTTCYPLVG